MARITTKEQFRNGFTHEVCADATGIAFMTDDNFWIARETARMQSHQYTTLKVDGDDPLRFLHVSLDDSEKVAYTKDAEHGRADIQTRTTMTKYCKKFGLAMPHDLPTSPFAGMYHGRATGIGV